MCAILCHFKTRGREDKGNTSTLKAIAMRRVWSSYSFIRRASLLGEAGWLGPNHSLEVTAWFQIWVHLAPESMLLLWVSLCSLVCLTRWVLTNPLRVVEAYWAMISFCFDIVPKLCGYPETLLNGWAWSPCAKRLPAEKNLFILQTENWG